MSCAWCDFCDSHDEEQTLVRDLENTKLYDYIMKEYKSVRESHGYKSICWECELEQEENMEWEKEQATKKDTQSEAKL